MNWKWKAFLQMALSVVPGGEHGNYLLQKYVTRTLPISDAGFADHVHYARQHIDAICRHSIKPVNQATFLEFGAGWDLISPLAFYAFGVQKQILLDVRKLLRPLLVNESIGQFQRIGTVGGFVRQPAKYLNGSEGASAVQLKEFYGIDYRAPCDLKQTDLEFGTIDCITSTSTLEHIPLPDLRRILEECHRVLRPGGIMSSIIDYGDHYSYFDFGISAYNYLKYSDTAWAFFNPSLHYQNRLRHPDYLNLLKDVGCEIVEEQRYGDSPGNRKIVEGLAVPKRFGRYSLDDLVVGSALIVSRKHV
jgi:SAM-dependent methyltransferase